MARPAGFLRLIAPAALGLVLLFVIAVLAGSGADHQVAPEHRAKKAAHAGGGSTVGGRPTARVSGRHDSPVPILMYHVTKAAPAATPYPELWVSPADFRGQMRWLADNGFTAVTMTQLFNYWDEGFKLPRKPVVISFDDGYPSHAAVARPALAAHHWPGVLFLELSNVGSPQTGLTSAMIEKLIAAGWEIGSHTIDHPDLTTLSGASLRREVAGSRRQIEAKFDVPVDFFCYPAGRFNAATVAAVRRAGYKGAVTVIEGTATPDRPFELKRVRIDGSDGVAGFAAKMRQSGQ